MMHVKVMNGLAVPCEALLPSNRVVGATVSRLISEVAAAPQASEPARRAAQSLQRLLGGPRVLDVELSPGTADEGNWAISALTDVPISRGADESRLPQGLTIRVSEPVRGGGTRVA